MAVTPRAKRSSTTAYGGRHLLKSDCRILSDSQWKRSEGRRAPQTPAPGKLTLHTRLGVTALPPNSVEGRRVAADTELEPVLGRFCLIGAEHRGYVNSGQFALPITGLTNRLLNFSAGDSVERI